MSLKETLSEIIKDYESKLMEIAVRNCPELGNHKDAKPALEEIFTKIAPQVALEVLKIVVAHRV